jgi:hypothetical protein
MESPIRRMSLSNVSGEWSDYTGVFLMWLRHGHLYWPWTVFGATMAGMVFYAAQLLMPSDARTGGNFIVGCRARRDAAIRASVAILGI